MSSASSRGMPCSKRGGAALHEADFAEAALQAFAAAAEGFVDGFGRRREAALEDGEGEADGAGALVVLEGLGAVELFADVFGDGGVEAGFGVGELVGDGVGDAFGEQGAAVELEELFLDHAAHEVGDVDLVDAVAEAALEAVAIQQGEEELEVGFLAVVGGGGHQQEVAGEAGEQLAEPVALGVADLAAPEGGGHFVGFVADDQVPAAVGGAELGLDVFVAGELVEAGDGEVVLDEPVAGAGGFELVVGDDVEGELEFAGEFVLPLLDEAAGADDEAALEVAAGDEFLDEEAGHDGFAGAGVVGQQEAEGLAGEHGFVDGGDLVGEGIDEGGVDGEDGVEEVGEADALGFGDEAEEGAVGVEAPGAAFVDDFEAGFVVAVEEFAGGVAGGVFVGEFEGVGAVPLDADDGDEAAGGDATDGGGGAEVLEGGQGWILRNVGAT